MTEDWREKTERVSAMLARERAARAKDPRFWPVSCPARRRQVTRAAPTEHQRRSRDRL
jgi:hypothetical protein